MSQASQEKPEPNPVLRAAGLMGIATLISRIMGLVREQVFAVLFGAGNLTDAFQVAFRIPNLLRDLFAEGAMSASLVPTFTQTRVEEGEERAWRVAGLVFRFLFIVVGLLSLVGIFFSTQLVQLYASSFRMVPGKFELAVRMTQVMFPFFPLVALAAAFMGILNACGAFFWPAFASALFNLASVVFGVGLSFWISHHLSLGFQPIEGMAVGVVLGGAVQAFCQLPFLYKKGYRWIAKGPQDPLWHQDPRLRQMLRLMVPGTIGLAATQINILVNTILATSQGTGAVSWLNYAFRLMQFPIGILGVSLASATLPKVSEQWVKKEFSEVSRTLVQSLRSTFALNLPAAAGLAFLSVPILELIFQYGRFYAEDTRATAWALIMYSIGLPAYSAVKVLVPACYAFGITRLPVISSLLAVCVTLVLNWIMIKPFGYWGLALGTSVAAIVNALFLLLNVSKVLEEKGEKLKLSPIFYGFLAYLLLALIMGGLCWLTDQAIRARLPDAQFIMWLGKSGLILGRLVRLAVVITEGAVFALVMARLFKLSEMAELENLFLGKMKKKLCQPRS